MTDRSALADYGDLLDAWVDEHTGTTIAVYRMKADPAQRGYVAETRDVTGAVSSSRVFVVTDDAVTSRAPHGRAVSNGSRRWRTLLRARARS